MIRQHLWQASYFTSPQSTAWQTVSFNTVQREVCCTDGKLPLIYYKESQPLRDLTKLFSANGEGQVVEVTNPLPQKQAAVVPYCIEGVLSRPSLYHPRFFQVLAAIIVRKCAVHIDAIFKHIQAKVLSICYSRAFIILLVLLPNDTRSVVTFA